MKILRGALSVKTDITQGNSSAKDKKPFYNKLWFSALVILGVIVILTPSKDKGSQTVIQGSQGNETESQKSAIRDAQERLENEPFSRQMLIDILADWDGYSVEDATFGADNSGANWGEQASETVKEFLAIGGYSRKEILDQLELYLFTQEQSVNAVDNCGADWNAEAVKAAEGYRGFFTTKKEYIDQLVDQNGFTREQAEHGVSIAGY